MDSIAANIKIKKTEYFFWLGLVGLAAGLFSLTLETTSGSVAAVPLNSRIPSEGQIALQLEQNQSEPVVESLSDEILNLHEEQQLVDLLRSHSFQTQPSLNEDLPVRTQTTGAWKTVRMRVTGYCACRKCCGKFADGLTADMHRICKGDTFVAADKKVPFGTQMIIPGYNNGRAVQVKDRGRLIYGNRLDLYFSNHRIARKWGVKYLDVKMQAED